MPFLRPPSTRSLPRSCQSLSDLARSFVSVLPPKPLRVLVLVVGGCVWLQNGAGTLTVLQPQASDFRF